LRPEPHNGLNGQISKGSTSQLRDHQFRPTKPESGTYLEVLQESLDMKGMHIWQVRLVFLYARITAFASARWNMFAHTLAAAK